MSALCRNVRHVRAEEFSDIRVYRAELVVREVMLFGKSPEEASASPMLDLLGFGFGQSIDMLAAALGMRLDERKATMHEMAVATAPIETPVGVLAPGTVAAQRFAWQGLVGGEPVITVRVNWLMGERHLDPPWTIGGERFEVEVEGDPSIHLTLRGLQPPYEHADLDRNPGIVATAMHCVNSIPALCEAPAGDPHLSRHAAGQRPRRRAAEERGVTGDWRFAESSRGIRIRAGVDCRHDARTSRARRGSRRRLRRDTRS